MRPLDEALTQGKPLRLRVVATRTSAAVPLPALAAGARPSRLVALCVGRRPVEPHRSEVGSRTPASGAPRSGARATREKGGRHRLRDQRPRLATALQCREQHAARGDMPQRLPARSLSDRRDALDLVGHDRRDRPIESARPHERLDEPSAARPPRVGIRERRRPTAGSAPRRSPPPPPVRRCARAGSGSAASAPVRPRIPPSRSCGRTCRGCPLRSSRSCSDRRRRHSGAANRRAPGSAWTFGGSFQTAAFSMLGQLDAFPWLRVRRMRTDENAAARPVAASCADGAAPTGGRTRLRPARRNATSTGTAGTGGTDRVRRARRTRSRVVDGRIAKKSSNRGAPVTTTSSAGTSWYVDRFPLLVLVPDQRRDRARSGRDRDWSGCPS